LYSLSKRAPSASRPSLQAFGQTLLAKPSGLSGPNQFALVRLFGCQPRRILQGGGGGIRTPGAFALRFSRPSPSTARPLLQTRDECGTCPPSRCQAKRPLRRTLSHAIILGPYMNVACESCGARYDLDEAKIPPSGLTMKCFACLHSFQVHGSQGPGI